LSRFSTISQTLRLVVLIADSRTLSSPHTGDRSSNCEANASVSSSLTPAKNDLVSPGMADLLLKWFVRGRHCPKGSGGAEAHSVGEATIPAFHVAWVARSSTTTSENTTFLALLRAVRRLWIPL